MKHLLLAAAFFCCFAARAQNDSLWTLVLSCGTTVVPEKSFTDYVAGEPEPAPLYGGFHASAAIWRNVLHYGEHRSFFDVGGGVEYLPFLRRVSLLSDDGLAFACAKIGARHQMYVIKKEGFEQAVMIGNAFPVERYDQQIGTLNPMVSEYFGYAARLGDRWRIGVKWNWNFVWTPGAAYRSIYAHAFDLSCHLAL